MDQIKNGLTTLWQRIFSWLPQLVGALVVLLIAYIVAKVLARLVGAGLRKVNFDDRLHTGRGGSFIERAVPSPTRLIEKIIYWIVFLWGVTIAVTLLGVPALTEIVAGIYRYLPNILAAILIFLVAGAISAAIDAFVLRILGDTPTGKIAGAIAPVVIMGIAVFMILEQLKIAPTIITITYACLIGSIFLGLALAFGLGGRDVAHQILQRAYEASQRDDAQYKKDLLVAKKRTQQQADKAKDHLKRAA